MQIKRFFLNFDTNLTNLHEFGGIWLSLQVLKKTYNEKFTDWTSIFIGICGNQ
jgi:hypothetical protein